MLKDEIPRALGMTRFTDAAGADPAYGTPEVEFMSKLANLAKMRMTG
jgi:hypothetical protein